MSILIVILIVWPIVSVVTALTLGRWITTCKTHEHMSNDTGRIPA